MPKLRVLVESVPDGRGSEEERWRALRDYVERMREELEYLFLHPETDLSRAAETDLEAHIGDKNNPHEVTAEQVGLGNVDNVLQYSADNPPPAPDAGDISYDNTASGLSATDLQEAVDELAQSGGGGTAASVSYDNTVSGLSATDVQDAIDELAQGGGGGGPSPATATPVMDSTGAVGTSLKYAREDHEHPSDTAKQDAVTASGILKGDGAGGISAAVADIDYQTPLTAGTDYQTPLTAGTDYQTPLVAGTDYQIPLVAGTDYQTPLTAGTDYQTPLTAGTDYQTPLTAGTDYATPAMIPSVPDPSDATPQALGTAAAGSSGDYSRADHVHGMPTASDVGALASDGTAVAASTLAYTYRSASVAAGWYQFLTITMPASRSRNLVLIISDSYAVGVGILAVRFNRTNNGANGVSVQWLETTIAIDDVRYVSDSTAGTLTLYFRKRTNTNGLVSFRVLLDSVRPSTTTDVVDTWSFTSVTEPVAATAAEADANAQAAQLAKVLGDPAGVNAAVGEYVSYNGELYTVNTAITSDMAASVFASYLDAVPDGGLNALNNQTLDGVYSCYGYRADLISTVDVQLKKDYVTDGTTYRIFAPLYLIDFNNPQTVDEYYLMLDQNNPSRFVRVTSNNSTRNITTMSFDPSTGVLTLTLNGTRRYVGADVRIAKQLI